MFEKYPVINISVDQKKNIEVSEYEGDNNWALLLDTDGFVVERTGDNFFIVKDKVIITPETRNILRGISRAYIFELADQLGLQCIEKISNRMMFIWQMRLL